MPLATVTQRLTHGDPNYGRAGGDEDEVSRGWMRQAGRRLERLLQRLAQEKEAQPARRSRDKKGH